MTLNENNSISRNRKRNSSVEENMRCPQLLVTEMVDIILNKENYEKNFYLQIAKNYEQTLLLTSHPNLKSRLAEW